MRVLLWAIPRKRKYCMSFKCYHSGCLKHILQERNSSVRVGITTWSTVTDDAQKWQVITK